MTRCDIWRWFVMSIHWRSIIRCLIFKGMIGRCRCTEVSLSELFAVSSSASTTKMVCCVGARIRIGWRPRLGDMVCGVENWWVMAMSGGLLIESWTWVGGARVIAACISCHRCRNMFWCMNANTTHPRETRWTVDVSCAIAHDRHTVLDRCVDVEMDYWS